MNASLGSITLPHVGGLAAEDEDVAGAYLHEILRAYQLCVPSTMPHFHRGPSFTYTQKHGGQCCRPDFLAVPLEWTLGVTASCTLPAVHAAHSVPDHTAAGLLIEAAFQAPCPHHAWKRRPIRASDVAAPENRAQVRHALCTAPCVAWDVSVHAHASILAQHVQKALMKIGAKRAVRPHHAYISPATWAKQQRVAVLRREVHRLTHVIQTNDLATGLKAWSGLKGLFGIAVQLALTSACTSSLASFARSCARIAGPTEMPTWRNLHTRCLLLRRRRRTPHTTAFWHTAVRRHSDLRLYRVSGHKPG